MKLSFKELPRGFAVACLFLVSFSLSVAEGFGIVGNVKRDYFSNHRLSDSVWFYKDDNFQEQSAGGGAHPILEWDNGRAFNVSETLVDEGNNQYIVQKVAYTLGSGGSVELTFTNPQFFDVSGTFQVNGAQFVRASDPNNPISMSASGTTALTVPANGEQTVTVTFSGFPDYVTYGYLRLNLIYYSEQTTLWSTQVAQNPWRKFARVYVTQSTPIGQQQKPWLDVLEDACSWADGQESATNCASGVTYGLFHSGLFHYSGAVNNYFEEDDAQDDYTAMYRLKKLCTRRAQYSYAIGSCTDSSGYLVLLMHALGVNGALQRLYHLDGGGVQRQFRTNYLCPTGLDWTEMLNYNRTNWWFHQVGVLSGSAFDACLALFLNLVGDVHMDAIWGWDLYGYWQTPNEQPVPLFLGLVDGRTGWPSGELDPTVETWTIDRLGALTEN